jgi:hypothetical protein
MWKLGRTGRKSRRVCRDPESVRKWKTQILSTETLKAKVDAKMRKYGGVRGKRSEGGVYVY